MEAGGRPVRLRCAVQTYEWGRTGESSAVARLFARNAGDGVETELEPARPYAEFWMGTHSSGPSFLLPEDGSKPLPLKSYILDNPGVLGDQVLDKWGTDIPFLFKVLSVAKALSIQAHPDKELAERLHRAQPSVYKDANHKPEMAIALTEFRALCGFVGFEELKDVLRTVPEITELVGNEEATKVMNIKEQCDHEEVKDSLQSIFTKLMSANKETVSELLSKLKSRLVAENQVRILTEKEKLALLLEKQYPSDIGVISSFFFNYVKLSPGEAVYIGANEPHAYLSGECIECMATSDNVVRAGLTPKFRDVKTLCSMLTYRQGFPEIMQGISLNHYITRYIPPFDEFEVDHISLPSGESVSLPGVPGPSIFVVVAGKGNVQVDSDIWEDMVEGHAYFVPAHCEFKFRAGAAGELELYRAGVNSRFCG